MPIGDYAEIEDFTPVPGGQYNVTLDEVSGTLSEDKPIMEVKYKINDGDQKDRIVSKKYYFTENTFKKWMPWQLGILGVWHDVKECENFDDGMIKAVELLKDTKKIFSATVEVDDWEYDGKSGTRNDIKIEAENVANPPETVGTFDKDAEIPF